MTKRILSALLAFALVLVCFSGLELKAEAATGIYAPYAGINYSYSSTVSCGTIRYISQVSSDSYFYSSYWPSSTFGYYTGPSVECGTASISMSLSYIGINKTPNDILSANNGATVFGYGWGGSTYKSYSASALATATDNYINGGGKYSPPVIHIPGYSTAGHYVVVIGRSGTTYQILDPWQRTVTSMTVSGSSATYSKYGYTTYDTIDQIHQWYNASAVLDTSSSTTDYTSSLEFYPSHCKVQCNIAMTVNTLPCSVGSNGSTSIESYAIGDIYTTTGIYKNTFGNYWYRVIAKTGEVGYMYGDNADLVEVLTSDITLTDATFPNGHVAGTSYNLSGTVSSSYNELTNVSLYVHSGFGTSGAQAVGYSDTPTSNTYALAYSYIDAYTKFGTLTAGNYTYAIYASYQNYYTTSATTMVSSTGTVTLADEYFVVVPSSVDQSTCAHTYNNTIVQAPTCTTSGTQIQACSTCGLIVEDVSVPASHSYGGWTTTAATCTTQGSRTRTCTTCGDVQTETIAVTGHSYTSTTVEGNCTTPGTTTYTCTACGYSYTETTTAGGHQYDAGVVVTPAGCNTTGVRKFTCTLCGYSYNKSIYATGHTYAAVVTAPTCTKSGYTTYTCTGCGTSYISDSVPATNVHTYNNGVVTAPTCTKSGYTTYTCTGCGTSYTDNVTNATGHSYKSVVTAPTCSTQGYTTYTCSACGYSYTGNTTPTSAHSYTSRVTAPTCTESGYTTYTCVDCGYSYVGSTVNATGHSYKSVVVAPTCTESGQTTYTCSACGHSYFSNVTNPTGHSYVNGICTTCGASDGSQIVAPTITLSYPTLSFEDQIQYNVYFTLSDLTNVAEMGLITFDSKLTDGTIAEAVDVIPGYTTSGSYYIVHSNGIPAKNLGDALYFKVYAKLTDGSYVYTDIAGYNAVAYAKTVLGSSSTSMDAKRLMVAMLNYGAEAQVNFNYKTDSLMNSFLTTAAQNLVNDYDETMVDDVVAADSAKAGHFVMQSGSFTSIFPTVSFEGAFSVNYYFTPGLSVDSSLTFVYWDADTYNSVDKLTTANCTGMMQMTQDGDSWTAAVEGIAAKDMDKTIYVVAIYKSGGTAYTSKVIPYSIGKYCEGIAANGNTFGAATAVYGYYAKTYFANL